MLSCVRTVRQEWNLQILYWNQVEKKQKNHKNDSTPVRQTGAPAWLIGHFASWGALAHWMWKVAT